MSSETASIEVDSLSKRYGSLVAVQNVSFRVERGQVVGFLGPNGAGKSTTMRILTGIIPATSGSAHICGMPVTTHAREIKPRLGYMPETNPLPDEMRVDEYLRFRARLKEVPAKERKERVDWAMQTCDLDRKARRKIIGNLSKGFRQRVGIADAILGKPDVIIMDEPTIGLDPHQILAIRDLINSLRGQMTVVISSHILAEVEMCCDRVIIINRGFMVAEGTLPELRQEFIPNRTYELRAKGDIEPLLAVLKRIDPDLALSDTIAEPEYGYLRHHLQTPAKGDQTPEFLQALFVANLSISGLQLCQPCLEDIFLAATRRTWEEESSLGGNANGKPEAEATAVPTTSEADGEEAKQA